MNSVRISAFSDPGQARGENQDSVLVVDLQSEDALDDSIGEGEICSERGPLLLVADGMGGSAGGREASRMACEIVLREMRQAPPTENRAILARTLRRALRVANQEIFEAAAQNKKLKGMGTTASVAALAQNTLVVAQIGDSRVYVLRGDSLTQVTRDQSVVSAMVSAGTLSEERAKYSMQKGRVLQALGAAADVEVSLSIAQLRKGDRILLCSDGLHGFVDDEAIAGACHEKLLSTATDSLRKLAYARGAPDNVSVIIAEVQGPTLKEPVAGVDQLHFMELDPSAKEGEAALTTTSLVQRRLAHKAGLRSDAPKRLPNTAQHKAIDTPVDAESELDAGSRVGWLTYLLVAALVAAAVFFALQWL